MGNKRPKALATTAAVVALFLIGGSGAAQAQPQPSGGPEGRATVAEATSERAQPSDRRAQVERDVSDVSVEKRGKYGPKKRKFGTKGRKGQKGFATGLLKVNYGSKRYFSGLQVSAKDHCAGRKRGDGKGAYLNGNIHFANGTVEHGVNVADDDGCGSGREVYNRGDQKFRKKITYVSGRLCERDKDGNRGKTCTKWKRIPNPYMK